MLDLCGVIKTLNFNRSAAINQEIVQGVCGLCMANLPWYDKDTSDKMSSAIIAASIGGRREVFYEAIDVKTKERHRRRVIFERRGSEIVGRIYGPATRSGKMWEVIKMKSALLVFAIMSLTACATVADLRQTEPTRTEVYRASFDDVAKCVADKIDAVNGLGNPTLRVNEVDRTAHLFAVIEPSGAAAYEFALFQQGAQVKVESRGMVTAGGRNVFPDKVWPLVDECAGVAR